MHYNGDARWTSHYDEWLMSLKFIIKKQSNEKSSANLETIIWYYTMDKSRSELKVKKKQVTKHGFRE